MFKWKKKGLIWAPSLNNEWAQEYGQNPNAVVLGDRIRIYFSGRKKQKDNKYISYIFFVDVERSNPSKIIAVHDKPILNTTGKGEPGCFDEFGTMPGSVLWREDIQEMWLYYVGWQRSNTLPYMWANGLAISKDRGVTFEKVREGPIVSSVYKYPYLHACPRVFNYGENNWFMWYASGVEWYECENRLNPIYVIMPAKSNDGLHWQLSEQPCIPPVYSKECQSGASVLEYGGLYHMFFSYRNVATLRDEQKQYRIGHAWSENLTDWHRDNSQAGLDVSLSGWDSEAVCYPHVVRVDDKTYMFYSGNKFGCSGFGYAELEG